MAIGSAGAPGAPAPAAPAAPSTSSRPSPHPVDGRRQGLRRRRRRPNTLPYALIAPAVAALVVMLGYPLLRLGILSLQKFGLRQQFGQPPDWVGLDNYHRILTDSYFWDVLWRTVTFAMVNVALTIGARPARGAAHAHAGPGHAAPREHRPDAGVGDAGPHRHRRLAVAVRHAVRARELGLHEARDRRLPGPLVAERADQLLHGGHDHRRLDGHPLRGLHAVRGDDARSRRRSRRPPASTAPGRGSGSGT